MTAADRAIATVTTLMERQRQALLTGDLAALAPLPERLEQALQRLTATHPDQRHLDVVQAAARHNAQLLLAAQRGLAQTRARQARHGAPPLTTYDASGRQAGAPEDGRLLSRR